MVTTLLGNVLVVLGASRRWPFRREGPNGSALLVEVRLLNSCRACIGRRRRGGSRGPHSQQWFPPLSVPGSMGGDRKNRVLGVDRGSGSRGRYNSSCDSECVAF
ncbi:hypothetical protein Taro_000669 [Colocasia esculenta]|uniref:Uncharacterized protein n=1 Tax=Colocasia esculenta TaxID=4460 RepID=A0A843TCQ3_COLES|nr:hypothetical protein [Colocasia esculenta]